MRILVFSDSHLSLPFEPKKFYFLRKIISSVDKVIINGDFWEGYGITFNQFVNSPWNKLFPLLKSKKTVYIYGNHDNPLFTDKRVKLFSDLQTNRFKININNQIYIFEHGNKLCPLFDENLLHKAPPKIWGKLSDIAFRFFTRTLKKRFTNLIYKRFNKVLKKNIAEQFKNNEIVICGHTHFAEIDLKNRLINTGFIEHGLAQYLIFDRNKFTAYEEWYDPPKFTFS